MGAVRASLERVARAERAVAQDRLALLLARERLKLATLAILARSETIVALYAAGALLGVAAPDLGRTVTALAAHIADSGDA